jgi:hypothetical protein
MDPSRHAFGDEESILAQQATYLEISGNTQLDPNPIQATNQPSSNTRHHT